MEWTVNVSVAWDTRRTHAIASQDLQFSRVSVRQCNNPPIWMVHYHYRSKLYSWHNFWKRDSFIFLVRSTLWPKSHWRLTQMCSTQSTSVKKDITWRETALNPIKNRPFISVFQLVWRDRANCLIYSVERLRFGNLEIIASIFCQAQNLCGHIWAKDLVRFEKQKLPFTLYSL